MKAILASELISELERFVEAIDKVLEADSDEPDDEATHEELDAVLTLGKLLAEYHEKESPEAGLKPAESVTEFFKWAMERIPELESSSKFDFFISRLFFNSFSRSSVKATEIDRGYLAYKSAHQSGHLDQLLAAFESGRIPIDKEQLNWKPIIEDITEDQAFILPWKDRLEIAIGVLKLSKRSMARRKPSSTAQDPSGQSRCSISSGIVGDNGVTQLPKMTDAQGSPMTLNVATNFVIEAFDAPRQLPTEREIAAVLTIGKMLAEHHKQPQNLQEPNLLQDEKVFVDWAQQADPIMRSSEKYCEFVLALFFKCFEGQPSVIDTKETGFLAYKRACETGTLKKYLEAFTCTDCWDSIEKPTWDTKEDEWLPHMLRDYRMQVARDRLEKLVELTPSDSPFLYLYSESNRYARMIKHSGIKEALLFRFSELRECLSDLRDVPSQALVWYDRKLKLRLSNEVNSLFIGNDGKPFTIAELNYLFCGIVWLEHKQQLFADGKKTRPSVADAFKAAKKLGWVGTEEDFGNFKKAVGRAKYAHIHEAATEFRSSEMSLVDILDKIHQMKRDEGTARSRKKSRRRQKPMRPKKANNRGHKYRLAPIP